MATTTRKDLSEYTIRIANAAQKEQYVLAGFHIWARGKSWEDYKVAFHECLEKGEWVHDGGVINWVLVARDDPDGQVYCGARTYRRKALLKEPGSAEIQDVYTYTITGVVTPVEHQRHGYATHLLKLLHYRLGSPTLLPPFPEAQWGPAPAPLSQEYQRQVPKALCSVLYSVVGPTFYEKVTIGQNLPGWVVDPSHSMEISWSLRAPSAPTESTSKNAWDWIYTRDLPAIGETLSAAAREDLVAKHQDSAIPVWMTDPASPGVLSYIPCRVLRPRSADWTHVYDNEPVGVRLPHPGLNGRGDAIVLLANALTLMPGLLVTYVYNFDADQLPTLLQALDEVGAQAGTKRGLMWGIAGDSPLGKAWLGQVDREVKLERRGDSENLLGVAWYGEAERRGEVADTQMYSLC